MHLPRRFPALIVALILLLGTAGCVTHTLLITVPEDGRAHARYEIEGDSLDVFDRRIPHPDVTGWTLDEREVGEDSTGNLVGRLVFSTSDLTEISHPLAPLGLTGILMVRREDGLLRNTVQVVAQFPSWQALDRYGDPEAYLPAEIRQLEESGMDSTLSPQGEEELEIIKAESQQLAAVDRYLRQIERVVRAEMEQADSAVITDALERFRPILRVHLMTLRGDPLEPTDPRDVSTDWYYELRGAMASAASEATGLPEARMLAAADSLEREYKRWVDLQDDTVRLAVVLEDVGHVSATPEPEEVRGDTLFWTVEGEDLQSEDLEIVAAGYDLRLPTIVILGAFVLLLIAALLRFAIKRGG